MSAPFRSNYPRGREEHHSEKGEGEPKIWSPDLAVALVGIADLLIGLQGTSRSTAAFSSEARPLIAVFFGAVLLALLALHLLLIFRRKWGMWLLFGLYLLGMVGAWSQRHAIVGGPALAAAPFLYRALLLIYIPMRIFRVFGPTPK